MIILKERRSSYIHSKRPGILDRFPLQATFFFVQDGYTTSQHFTCTQWMGKKGREMQTSLEAQSTEIVIHIILVQSPLARPNMKSHSDATDTGKHS